MAGRPCDVYKINTVTGEREGLPPVAAMTFTADERIVSVGPGGAGYGDPLDRDPDRVRLRAREGWISLQKAHDVYGVVIDTSVELYAVDHEQTKQLRERLRKEKSGT